MVNLNIMEGTQPRTPGTALVPEQLMAVIGATKRVAATGDPEVLAVGTLTEVDNAEQDAIFGTVSDGTLPQALEAIRDVFPNARVVAIRCDADGAAAPTVTAIQAVGLVSSVLAMFGRRVTILTTAEKTWNENAMGDVDNAESNDLVSAMENMCESINCIGVVSAPDTTIAEALAWQKVNTANRLLGADYVVIPPGEVDEILGAPYWAAGLYKNNIQNGYWRNPHNTQVPGIGTVKPALSAQIRVPSAESQQIVCLLYTSPSPRDS